jgi:hypothetical protein
MTYEQGDTMSKTYYEAVEMVVSVLRDGQRIDRMLRVADDGHYYTTPDKTFLTSDGPEPPPFVEIPFGGAISDDEAFEWACGLINELDRHTQPAAHCGTTTEF